MRTVPYHAPAAQDPIRIASRRPRFDWAPWLIVPVFWVVVLPLIILALR